MGREPTDSFSTGIATLIPRGTPLSLLFQTRSNTKESLFEILCIHPDTIVYDMDTALIWLIKPLAVYGNISRVSIVSVLDQFDQSSGIASNEQFP